MKTTELKAFVREDTSKRETKSLRRAGKVPGVIYDNNTAKHIFIDAKEARKIIYTPDTYIVKLDLDGAVSDAIVRETQFHPVKEHLIHIDFMKVSDEKPMEVTLPLKMAGTPVGVAVGGKLVVKLRKIKVKGIPSKLPEYIEVNVSELELGSTIKVNNIQVGDIQVMTPSSSAVASVEIPRSLRSAQDGVEGDEGATEEAEAATEEE